MGSTPVASARSGLVLALGSAASFATSGVLATSLLSAGWTPASAVTLRIAGAALVLAAPALAQLRGRRPALWAARWRVLAFGVFAVAGCQFCFFSAVATVPVSLALLVEYAGVLLVVVWAWAVGGQRPRLLTAVGGTAALAGLALVLGVGRAGAAHGAGLAWAVTAAACLAVYFVLAAHDDDALPPLVTAWAGMVVGGSVLAVAGALGVLPLAAPRADVVLAGTAAPWWVPVAALVVVATAFPYVTGMAAARRLGATTASFVALTEVLFAAAWAWTALGQSLRGVQLLGAAVVMVGIVVVRAGERAQGVAR